MVWWLRGKSQAALFAFAVGCVIWDNMARRDAAVDDATDATAASAKRSTGTVSSYPRYIFGVSTGHAGSSTTHAVLAKDCGDDSVVAAQFEMRLDFEKRPETASVAETCEFVRTQLIPAIHQARGNATSFVDMGHFHNRGPVRFGQTRE